MLKYKLISQYTEDCNIILRPEVEQNIEDFALRELGWMVNEKNQLVNLSNLEEVIDLAPKAGQSIQDCALEELGWFLALYDDPDFVYGGCLEDFLEDEMTYAHNSSDEEEMESDCIEN